MGKTAPVFLAALSEESQEYRQSPFPCVTDATSPTEVSEEAARDTRQRGQSLTSTDGTVFISTNSEGQPLSLSKMKDLPRKGADCNPLEVCGEGRGSEKIAAAVAHVSLRSLSFLKRFAQVRQTVLGERLSQ